MKTTTNTLLAICLLAGCTAIHDAKKDEDRTEWGSATDGIRCSLKPKREEVLPEGPVVLDCRVENVGRVPARLYLSRIEHFWSVQVSGPKVLTTRLPPGPGPATESGFLDLKPGETRQFEWSLAEGNGIHRWSLAAPGNYRIVLVYHVERYWLDEFKQYGLDPDGKWIGEFKSNPVTVTVK